MISRFVMFIKPTRIKITTTIIIVSIASFFFCGIYKPPQVAIIPGLLVIWISPLLFPAALLYNFPTLIRVEDGVPKNISILLPSWMVERFDIRFEISIFPSKNTRWSGIYLFLFQGAPKLFVLLFFTNLPYWYFMACILEPVVRPFLKSLEAKLQSEVPVFRSRPITFAAILHLLGGILMFLYIVITDAYAILPDFFRIYKTVHKICYLIFILVFSILFVVNFVAAIFLWRCLKHGNKLTILVFVSALYILLPWVYPMVIARISAAVSIIPLILIIINRFYHKKVRVNCSSTYPYS